MGSTRGGCRGSPRRLVGVVTGGRAKIGDQHKPTVKDVSRPKKRRRKLPANKKASVYRLELVCEERVS